MNNNMLSRTISEELPRVIGLEELYFAPNDLFAPIPELAELQGYSQEVFPDRLVDIVDPAIVAIDKNYACHWREGSNNGHQGQINNVIVSVTGLRLLCSKQAPAERISLSTRVEGCYHRAANAKDKGPHYPPVNAKSKKLSSYIDYIMGADIVVYLHLGSKNVNQSCMCLLLKTAQRQ
ncbi:hypothetical protein C2845_PM09G10300 [Panicum miliaceum]|uniref:Uncharacterized protein n=1 Tax=Panicum miliaceum TaxID=4540 RepID=A0A3L6S3E7_PANMI|nr:hypothetical protein C2845_PM09G10300 [Panicum miliaceum]